MKKPVNYFFRWKGGGYNSVIATSKKEALQKATEMGKGNDVRKVTLVPDADLNELWESPFQSPSAAPPKERPKGRVRRALETARDMPPTGPTPFQSAHPAVVEWLSNYTGTFPFYLSLKEQYERRGDLSERQCESVYKAIACDGIKVERPINGGSVLADVELLLNTIREGGVTNLNGAVWALEALIKKHKPAPVEREFTIAVGETIRINKFHAKRIGDAAGLTRAHFVFEVVGVLDESPKAYRLKLKAKAQRSGHCCVCGLPLTNPESVMKGIGPDCGDGYKLDWNSDKDLLLQLSEKLSIYSEVTTWLPKAAIKERL